jgi:hypothetical protein
VFFGIVEGEKMNKKEKSELLEAARLMQGRRKTRYIDGYEIHIMSCLDRKRSLNGKVIRVYSVSGFVPNSYGNQAKIDYVERYYDDLGIKKFRIGHNGASRSYGRGATITVNGRAYE